MKRSLLLSMLLVLLLPGCILRQANGGPSPTKSAPAQNSGQAAFNAATEYSEKSGGVSILVWRNGETLFEQYSQGTSANDAHVLHSGTKSFSCSMAVAASMQGLLTFDERAADTITEWKSDPQKSKITIRQLISLSSGLSGGVQGETPTYSDALNFKMIGQPGEKFDYGPVPFQVFGEVMKRKLGGASPLDYLDQKVFKPIGLTYESWTFTSDGDPHIPNGAYLTAREWLKYGILILNVGEWQGQRVLDESLLNECFVGSVANPEYGISFWLPGVGGGDISAESVENGTVSDAPSTAFPADLIQASGAGGQRLYIIPSLGVIIVRQAEPGLFQNNPGQFSDGRFFQLIMPAFIQ